MNVLSGNAFPQTSEKGAWLVFPLAAVMIPSGIKRKSFAQLFAFPDILNPPGENLKKKNYFGMLKILIIACYFIPQVVGDLLKHIE